MHDLICGTAAGGDALAYSASSVGRRQLQRIRAAACQRSLPNAQDASYFAIALATMPSGMLGLLISGIFASTMGQMDSGLNRNAEYFIKIFIR